MADARGICLPHRRNGVRGDRSARRRAGTAAGAWAALGAPRGAAPDEEARRRRWSRCCRPCSASRRSFRPARPAATSIRRTPAASAATRAATRRACAWSRKSRTCGRSTARACFPAAITSSAGGFRRWRRAARGPGHRQPRPARQRRRHRGGRPGDERHARRARRPPIISPSGWRSSRSASPSSPTACRSAASSTISTRARCAGASRAAPDCLKRLARKTKSAPWPFDRSSKSRTRACAQISKPVEDVDDELRTLVADMFETMYDAPGIGLAAIQVGVPKRVLVIDLQEPEEEGGEPVQATRGSSSTPRSSSTRTRTCPTPRAACRCPTNMPRSTARTKSAPAGWTGRQGPRGRDRRPARRLPPARDGSSRRRAVHRPSVAPEAQHDPQEARQAAERSRLKRIAGVDRRRGVPAILGTFAAHLRAQLAMLVIVLLALRRAGVADPGAEFEHFAKHLFVRSGPAQRQPGRRPRRRRRSRGRRGCTRVMSIFSAAQASAQLRHIFAQYIRWWTASPSGWFTWPCTSGCRAIILRMDIQDSPEFLWRTGGA